MTIWKDVNVPIREKAIHIKKIGKRIQNSFINTVGDIPVLRFNEITKKFEDVLNLRGLAYATRKRLSYRKNKKQK